MTVEGTIPPQVSLLKGEKIIMRLQRRYASIFTSILSFIATALLLSLSSVIRNLAQYSQSLEVYFWLFIYLIIVGFACLFALMALVGYFYVRGHLYILTNRRIILFRKFITISVREIAYSEITDIIMNQGPIARILKYGSITPLSPGVRGFYAVPYPYMRRSAYSRVELKDVNQPSKVMNELFTLVRFHRSA
ncbi:MAG: PH domain-containing protein [Candidatus Bathycorpusculaceae bacterium]